MSSSNENGANMTPEERERRIELARRRQAAQKNQSQSQTSTGKRRPPLNAQGKPMTRAEYEEARRKAIAKRRMQEQARQSSQDPREQQRKQSTPKRRPQRKPSSESLIEAQYREENEQRPLRKAELQDKVDRRTGKTYKELPKTVMTNGNPELAVDDFNVDDLQSEADSFLGHLRVPPNKAEMDQLIAQKKAMEAEQRKKHSEEVRYLEEKHGNDKLAWTASDTDDDLETTNEKKKGFLSKLFKK